LKIKFFIENIKAILIGSHFNMKIRNAILKDSKSIAENNLLLAKESEDINIEYKTVLEGVKNIITDKQKGIYLIAEENNKIIGQIMITYEWSDWQNKNIWWLQSIYIPKSWRKKGVFKKLLKTIKERAIKNKVDTLRLYVYSNNINAKKVYNQVKMIKKSYDFYQIILKK
jgi:GNAT superfamily N-acetyltransferase